MVAGDNNLREVPNLHGLSAEEAEKALNQQGFIPSKKRSWSDKGYETNEVIRSSPPAGSMVPAGSEVVITYKGNLKVAVLATVAVIALIAAAVALFLSLRPEPIIPEDRGPVNQGPDESKAVQQGADSRAGGLLIAPSYTKEAGGVGTQLPPVTVTNRSTRAQKLYLYYVPLSGNTLYGTPEYKVSDATLAQGEEQIQLNKGEMNLQPGEKDSVIPTVVGPPPDGQRDLIGAVVIEAGRDDVSKASESVRSGVQMRVNNVYRVTATQVVEFLPRTLVRNIIPELVRGTQEKGGVKFIVRARNQGNSLDGPDAGQLTITNAGGQTVFDQAIEPGQGMVPGSARDLLLGDGPSALVKGLNPGNYTARASLDFSGRRRSIEWRFRIAADGQLPTPRGDFAAKAFPYTPNVGDPFSIAVEARNTGTKAYAPVAEISIFKYGEVKVLQKKRVKLNALDIGQIGRGEAQFKGLDPEGNYEATVRIFSDDGLFIGQTIASILVGGPQKDSEATIRDWMSANPFGTLLIGFGLVGLLILLGLLAAKLLGNRKSPKSGN